MQYGSSPAPNQAPFLNSIEIEKWVQWACGKNPDVDPDDVRSVVLRVLLFVNGLWCNGLPPADPPAYISTSIQHRVISAIRAEGRHKHAPLTDVHSAPAKRDHTSEDLIESANGEMEKLPKRQREALRQKFFEGAPPATAAKNLGVSAATYHRAVKEGLETLRRRLGR